MTEERLAEIEARCAAATPNGSYPWVKDHPDYDTLSSCFDDDATDADHAFIAHVRTDLPDAVAEIRRLRAALLAVRRKVLSGLVGYQMAAGVCEIVDDALADPVEPCDV